MKVAPHTTSQARSPPSGAGDWSTASLSVAASASAVGSFSVTCLALDCSFAGGRISRLSIFAYESFMVADMKYSSGWLAPAVRCFIRGCRKNKHTASTWLSHQESHIFPFLMYDFDDRIGLGVLFYFACPIQERGIYRVSDIGETQATRSAFLQYFGAWHDASPKTRSVNGDTRRPSAAFPEFNARRQVTSPRLRFYQADPAQSRLAQWTVRPILMNANRSVSR